MSDFPEHDKLEAVKDQSRIVGKFLEWMMGEQDWTIARYRLREEEYEPVGLTIEQILAKYFGVDPDKLEAEKRNKMLATCRNHAAPVDPLHEEHRRVAKRMREINDAINLGEYYLGQDRYRELQQERESLLRRLGEIHAKQGKPKEAK